MSERMRATHTRNRRLETLMDLAHGDPSHMPELFGTLLRAQLFVRIDSGQAGRIERGEAALAATASGPLVAFQVSGVLSTMAFTQPEPCAQMAAPSGTCVAMLPAPICLTLGRGRRFVLCALEANRAIMLEPAAVDELLNYDRLGDFDMARIGGRAADLSVVGPGDALHRSLVKPLARVLASHRAVRAAWLVRHRSEPDTTMLAIDSSVEQNDQADVTLGSGDLSEMLSLPGSRAHAPFRDALILLQALRPHLPGPLPRIVSLRSQSAEMQAAIEEMRPIYHSRDLLDLHRLLSSIGPPD